MAKKTFISYKYSEALGLRDKIIAALGDNARYYQGETSESPDLTDNKTETIRQKLKDMIWGTSVTIVIASPNMINSNWIDWEIKYSLRKVKRGEVTSGMNGVVVVAMKDSDDSYDWLIRNINGTDGCTYYSFDMSKLPDIITKNMFNQDPKEYSCPICRTVNMLTGNYMTIVKEDIFLKNIDKYIENAYEKSKNPSGYIIQKDV